MKKGQDDDAVPTIVTTPKAPKRTTNVTTTGTTTETATEITAAPETAVE